jgi:hypothetical protein
MEIGLSRILLRSNYFMFVIAFILYLHSIYDKVNPLNAELNPICHLLALLRAHQILHVSRIRVKEDAITNRT